MVSPSVCLQLDGILSSAGGSVQSKPYFHRFLLSVSHCAPPSAALTIDGEPAADPWSGFGRDLGPCSPQEFAPIGSRPLTLGQTAPRGHAESKTRASKLHGSTETLQAENLSRQLTLHLRQGPDAI
ncbi:hypothetical protein E2C01_075917 [Portunus trituberculatus]|uniref:Uncharacterized protein n=1 Tax=Portunus trituberculatus TaxID=210409 RepID=A0A5B7IA10_PORTR|nr:hypothetical protein [Portunus trituberculatus]